MAKVWVQRRDGAHNVSFALYKASEKRKQVQINGKQATRIGELIGNFHGILFSPEDLLLVRGGPGERRKFLDMELSQLRPLVFLSLQRYARILGQRNSLLRGAQMKQSSLATLDDWDLQLADAGAVLVAHRRAFVEALAPRAQRNYMSIAGEREPLIVQYQSQIDGDGDQSALADQFLARLHKAREDDIRRALTSVGPHRDDMRLLFGTREARIYGSQGQQRSAVLALKLAELEAVREERGENPVLLLDDVMSELDPYRRRQLVERITEVQTIITCTDRSDLGGANPGAVYYVQNGALNAAE
jgi:DNA replication and repair protein RecF